MNKHNEAKYATKLMLSSHNSITEAYKNLTGKEPEESNLGYIDFCLKMLREMKNNLAVNIPPNKES